MIRLIALCLACILAATAATAQVVNGDFSAGPTGWTPAASGSAGVQFTAFGWPADSVNLRRVWTLMGDLTGTASVTQTFECNGEGEGGTCDIRLDRLINTNGPVVTFIINIDGDLAHSFTHGPLHRSDWTPVTVQVGCGLHTLVIGATATVAANEDDWNVNVDNVVAVCEGSVANEVRTFGALKAIYR